MNIKVILLSFLFSLGLNGLMAQGPPQPHDRRFDRERMERNPERKQRIEAARKNFLKEEMGLTDVEAEQFFPLLKTHEERMKALAKEGRRKHRNKEIVTDLSEAEALKMIEAQMQHETEMLALRKSAIQAYLKVIPAAKLVKLEPAKRAFRKKLLDRMKRRRRH